MYTDETLTETIDRQNNNLYDELSPRAKKMLHYIWKSATFCSPLQYCRTMQEDAKGDKYATLCEVENYLINE